MPAQSISSTVHECDEPTRNEFQATCDDSKAADEKTSKANIMSSTYNMYLIAWLKRSRVSGEGAPKKLHIPK